MIFYNTENCLKNIKKSDESNKNKRIETHACSFDTQPTYLVCLHLNKCNCNQNGVNEQLHTIPVVKRNRIPFLLRCLLWQQGESMPLPTNSIPDNNETQSLLQTVNAMWMRTGLNWCYWNVQQCDAYCLKTIHGVGENFWYAVYRCWILTHLLVLHFLFIVAFVRCVHCVNLCSCQNYNGCTAQIW